MFLNPRLPTSLFPNSFHVISHHTAVLGSIHSGAYVYLRLSLCRHRGLWCSVVKIRVVWDLPSQQSTQHLKRNKMDRMVWRSTATQRKQKSELTSMSVSSLAKYVDFNLNLLKYNQINLLRYNRINFNLNLLSTDRRGVLPHSFQFDSFWVVQKECTRNAVIRFKGGWRNMWDRKWSDTVSSCHETLQRHIE